MMAEVDTGEQDVRAALAQLSSGSPEPEQPPPQEQTNESHEVDADVQRLADCASDLIEGPRAVKERERRAPIRDDAGRFAKAEAPTPQQPDERTEEIAAQIDAEIDKRQPTTEPGAMSKATRVMLDKLAGEGRLSSDEHKAILDEFNRRELGSKNGFEKFRERYRAIEDMLAEVKEPLRQLGFKSEKEAVRHLLEHNRGYTQNPVGYVAHLIEHARRAGADFTPLVRHFGLVPADQAGQPHQLTPQQIEEYVGHHRAAQEVARYTADENFAGIRDPEIKQLMSQVLYHGHAQGLHDAHDMVVLHLARQGRKVPDAILGPAVARAEVQQFFSDPNNEFAEMVRPVMQKLLSTGQATDLPTAYNKALAQHPKLRQFSAQALDFQKKLRASNASLSGAPHGGPPRSERKHAVGSFNDVAADVRDAIGQLA
jgi:hypothetical protein